MGFYVYPMYDAYDEIVCLIWKLMFYAALRMIKWKCTSWLNWNLVKSGFHAFHCYTNVNQCMNAI